MEESFPLLTRSWCLVKVQHIGMVTLCQLPDQGTHLMLPHAAVYDHLHGGHEQRRFQTALKLPVFRALQRELLYYIKSHGKIWDT